MGCPLPGQPSCGSPGSLVLYPSLGSAVLLVVLLIFASLEVAGCWQCSSQRLPEPEEQGHLLPWGWPLPSSRETQHPREPHRARSAPFPRNKVLQKSPSGARKEPPVGLSTAVPRQGAARGEQSQRAALRPDLQHRALPERGWVLLGCGRLRLYVGDFNLILGVVCPPTV